jgi:LysR family transcriptional regulator, transcription activator of glutamate synthase operon
MIDEHRLTFRDLEIFLAFAQTEHLGRAAEMLGCTAGAVQRRVRAIEARLGVALVEKDGRRVQLLHAGHVLAERAAQVVRSRTDVVEAVLAASGRARGVLRVGHMFSLGLSVVPRYLAALRAEQPGLRVELRQGRTNAILAQLLAGEIDAAFVAPCPNEADLAVVPLFTESVALAVCIDDPLAARESVDPFELRERPFVALAEGAGSRVDLVQACARAGFVPHIAIEVGDMCTLESIVAAGLAISIVPEEMRHHRHPRLARVPLRDAVATQRTVGLVYPREARMDAPLAGLVALARRDARERENRQATAQPR